MSEKLHEITTLRLDTKAKAADAAAQYAPSTDPKRRVSESLQPGVAALCLQQPPSYLGTQALQGFARQALHSGGSAIDALKT